MLGHILTNVLSSFFSLLVIINPIGIMPLYLIYTAGDSIKSKKRTIKIACFTIVILTFITSIAGSYLFQMLGVSMSGLEVAGGILLTLIGLNMMSGKVGKKGTESETEEAVLKENVAIVPLAIPMMTGPAYISALTIFTQSNWYYKIIMAFSGIPLAIIVFLVLIFADKINKILGVTGVIVTTRITGIIITSVAVQSFVRGVQGLWYHL